ncbi:MAG: hypothetical protein R2939_20330 [Kofleriaceae bacterium]
MAGDPPSIPPGPRTMLGHAAPTPAAGVAPAPPPEPPPPEDLLDRRRFVAFLKISSRRAFRLRIEPSEVLPSERAELLAVRPPITEPSLQAFLAWRRSVLFLVAVALVPLTIIGLIAGLRGSGIPLPLRLVKLAPAVAEGLFCWICWQQLKRWAQWRRQRRWLFVGWLLFLLTPFIVFLYPLRLVFEELVGSSKESLAAMGVSGVYKRAVLPFVFAMIAMLQLAPKAISLMPGLIRASLVIKLIFPGSSAPGWLIFLTAPLYAMFAYVILVVPYQFTGSGWFVAGMLGLIAGQVVLARAGYALAKPQTELEALVHIRRVRAVYMVVMVLSAALIVIALGSLVDKFLRVSDVVTAVMKFETNVLILTMIGADLVIANLDQARGNVQGRVDIEAQTEATLAKFVGSQPPQTGPR